MKRYIIIISIIISQLNFLFAKEGMWIPLLLGRNIEDMQAMGLKLSTEDMYSINNSSLKDAVVIFGGGCTGEVISPEGLLLTNQHCGLYTVQAHSSVENDYLTNGFWAKSKEEELSNPGLKVTFLVSIADVTNKVLMNVEEDMSELLRKSIIDDNIAEIISKTISGTHYKAEIKPFYYGNEYYMFVYEVFEDIRLVGSPPVSIGNFGGDTDNWMWPRHSGDFMLYRIYSDKNNKPAKYSPDNVPYKPKNYLKINIDGVEENDFTMIFGYPGSTQQYLTSYEVDYLQNKSLPSKIHIRDLRIKVMSEYMKESDEVRIKYASKYNHVSNACKKWKGMIRGLDRLDAIEKKKEFEDSFIDWVNKDENLKKRYDSIFDKFSEKYNQIEDYNYTYDYLTEAILSIELLGFSGEFVELVDFNDWKQINSEKVLSIMLSLRNRTRKFFKNYYQPIDQEICKHMLNIYKENVSPEFYPESFRIIDKKYKGDISKYVDKLYEETIFTDENEIINLIDNLSLKGLKKIINDPLFILYADFINMYVSSISKNYKRLNNEIDSLYRVYMEGIQLFKKNELIYPDANFTMRVTYGKVEKYMPGNAITYNYQTSMKGVIEKEETGLDEYYLSDKYKELYRNKDFEEYTGDSTMNVCFISSNHTSGGNSGSPVLNDEGQLIGINFDRNWEGTMSDIMYDPEQCRNIAVDIRYMLFLVDKLGDARYLIDEMSLVGNFK